MEKSYDRISELPDAILHQILSLMPMKSATRTSILSKVWRNHWKCFSNYTKIVDFGEEFASVQTAEEFSATVDCFIQQYKGNKVETFRLYFDPGCLYQSHANKWIEFAATKGVTELDLDFCRDLEYDFQRELCGEFKPFKLPLSLFSCNSIIHLILGRCDFSLPLNFNGFRGLETLHLKQVHITGEMIDSLILNCPLLEELDVRECFSLDYIKVFGPDLRLRILTVVSYGLSSIEISAPNLRSFHYCGDLFYVYSFMNISSLDDVLFNSIGYEFTEPDHDYIQILTDLAHVKVLTVCDGPLMHITFRDEDKQYTWGLPITFPNVQELQLLLTSICNDTLSYIYGFFRNCFFPSLEKLFIQVPAIEMIEMDERYNTQRMVVEEPSNCIFDNLKSIKITGFKGHINEMRLVKFLLEKAIVLEALILIVKKDSTVYSEYTQILPLPSLHDQLVSLPKASSDARIVLCEQSDDDNKLLPTHTEVYSPVDPHDYQTAISSIQMNNVTLNSMRNIHA